MWTICSPISLGHSTARRNLSYLPRDLSDVLAWVRNRDRAFRSFFWDGHLRKRPANA